jgi:hypothetical protein
MQRFNIPVSQYREMAHHLNPVHFDANDWVALAKATGMKYLVTTAKHHDGFAMYHSSVSKYNDRSSGQGRWTAGHSGSSTPGGIRFGFEDYPRAPQPA